jgi:hypothetical protein
MASTKVTNGDENGAMMGRGARVLLAAAVIASLCCLNCQTFKV